MSEGSQTQEDQALDSASHKHNDSYNNTDARRSPIVFLFEYVATPSFQLFRSQINYDYPQL